MRIHHTTSLLALALTSTCGAADAQQGYGYPQQSGPAAPSTIPGRGDSEARVPNVDPAPVAMPKPRKPKPQPQPSPWGGSAPTKPATPPVASQPPVASKPPVAQGNTGKPPATQTGTPPNGPVVVVTPGQNTPPPSQPQSGANDRLTSAYRGLGSSTAVIRNGGTEPATGTAAVMAPALVCAKNGNTPKIMSVQPANDASLQSGQAFIVQGLCFGSDKSTLRVTLPTQYGRIQGIDAKILDWQDGKILAQLPDGITKATPGAASVEVVSATGARGAKDAAFEPRWELVVLPGEGRIVDCANAPKSALGNNTMESCVIGGERKQSPGFLMQGNKRGGFGSEGVVNPAATFGALFYTPEDIDKGQANIGKVSFEIDLPAFAKLQGCEVSAETFETVPGIRDATASIAMAGNIATLNYRLNGTGYPGWLVVSAHCKAWVPAGLVAK